MPAGTPLQVSCSASVAPGQRLELDYLPIYGYYAWGFPLILQPGWWFNVTDILFSDKNLPPRSSGVILDGLYTVRSHDPQVHLVTPIVLPPGVRLTGRFDNQSAEAQNMIVVVLGTLVQV